MAASRYDVVVVGGGIHGAGIAQAAAAARYQTLLLEKEQPAAGTSSRSSKLIHGGLRYLEMGQFGLVRESLKERELLLQIAPGLVRLVPFLIPVYTHTSRRPWQIRLGLSFYTLLTRFQPSGRFAALKRSEWDSLVGLRKQGLLSVFSYFDAQTDDAALTRAVLASALALGAEACYPARFVLAVREPDGYRVHYTFQGREEQCRCTVLVNAGGPWVNHIQEAILPTPPKLEIDLIQGAHICLDQPISASIFYTEAPHDQRAVFIMPWHSGTLVGTTETLFVGTPDQVEPRPEEIAYLEETLRFYFPDYQGQLVNSLAGLRVLPKGHDKPFYRTRETILLPDDARRPHLIAVYGGKLTVYRATAARVMKLACKTLPRTNPIARTEELSLVASPSRAATRLAELDMRDR